MAAIDYATCGVNDVITHSLKLHPQLLADRLRFHARVHAQFADATDLGDYTIPDDVDVRREVFSCAAVLQNLHPITQEVIAAREDARKAPHARSG